MEEQKKQTKPNNFIVQKCTATSFFRALIEFFPSLKLSSREKDVAARILFQYFKLKDSIQDPEVLRDVLWSQNSRKDMRESLGMSQAHFQMILGKLRSSGFLVDGHINWEYIPNMTDDPRFVLCIYFDWSSKSNPINNG